MPKKLSIWKTENPQISYPEQLAQLFDFTDGRCERHQNHNKASKGTGFEFENPVKISFFPTFLILEAHSAYQNLKLSFYNQVDVDLRWDKSPHDLDVSMFLVTEFLHQNE